MVTREDEYRGALSAIRDEVGKLLAREDLPEDVEYKLQLIESIARHGHDVRSDEEPSGNDAVVHRDESDEVRDRRPDAALAGYLCWADTSGDVRFDG